MCKVRGRRHGYVQLCGTFGKRKGERVYGADGAVPLLDDRGCYVDPNGTARLQRYSLCLRLPADGDVWQAQQQVADLTAAIGCLAVVWLDDAAGTLVLIQYRQGHKKAQLIHAAKARGFKVVLAPA